MKIIKTRFWDRAIQVARWQHCATERGVRFAVPGTNYYFQNTAQRRDEPVEARRSADVVEDLESVIVSLGDNDVAGLGVDERRIVDEAFVEAA